MGRAGCGVAGRLIFRPLTTEWSAALTTHLGSAFLWALQKKARHKDGLKVSQHIGVKRTALTGSTADS
ncbi:hypothetical protein PSEUDO8Z_170244 [Pseudomonas sp. 8Z]|nr:hypothetical protein PSEUDO8Z_170244 [Pseudomonas sp. 8Z]